MLCPCIFIEKLMKYGLDSRKVDKCDNQHGTLKTEWIGPDSCDQ